MLSTLFAPVLKKVILKMHNLNQVIFGERPFSVFIFFRLRLVIIFSFLGVGIYLIISSNVVAKTNVGS